MSLNGSSNNNTKNDNFARMPLLRQKTFHLVRSLSMLLALVGLLATRSVVSFTISTLAQPPRQSRSISSPCRGGGDDVINARRLRRHQPGSSSSSSSLNLFNRGKKKEQEQDDDENDENDEAQAASSSSSSSAAAEAEAASLQPKSRLTDYVTQYLDGQNNNDADGTTTTSSSNNNNNGILNDISDATHLIAIPMDTCHELLIELESVQRAILYHCPILVHSCIVPANTKLPLLYVQSPNSGSGSASSDDNSNKRRKTNAIYTTSILGDTIRDLVQVHFFDSQRNPVVGGNDENGNDTNDTDDEEVALNEDGIRPFTMTFQSLEIDGPNNNILNTVGKENDYGTVVLQEFVSELATALISKGWNVALPNDPHNKERNTEDDSSNGTGEASLLSSVSSSLSSFRPRVPFMELPTEMNDNIEKYKNLPDDVELTEEDIQFLKSDQGGNGISPIFWAQWWDDIFGTNIRLPAIGVYPNQQDTNNQQQTRQLLTQGESLAAMVGGGNQKNNDNDSYWLQYESIELPKGSVEMQQSEAKFQKYQDDRLVEEQIKQDREEEEKEGGGGAEYKKKGGGFGKSAAAAGQVDNGDVSAQDIPDDDIMLSKTRERLEAIYQRSSADDIIDASSIDIEEGGDIASKTPQKLPDDHDEDSDNSDVKLTGDSSSSKPRTSTQGTSSKDGYLDDWTKQRIQSVVDRQKQLAAEQRRDKPPIEDNPVFQKYKNGTLTPKSTIPSDQGGAAQVLPPYPSREHFTGIWRVVSSPTGFATELPTAESSENLILRVDGTTAGGPILDQELKQKAAGGTWSLVVDDDDDDGRGDKSVRLRIRLVIPPKRERILVMEGEVTRMDMTSDGAPMTTSKAFGIPELEEKAKQVYKDMDDLMYCGGEVRVQLNFGFGATVSTLPLRVLFGCGIYSDDSSICN